MLYRNKSFSVVRDFIEKQEFPENYKIAWVLKHPFYTDKEKAMLFLYAFFHYSLKKKSHKS